MIYWKIFLAFFIPGIVGYGGGPASIPLIQNEVVENYQWLTVEEFGEVLAIGNALPGPIATKMAGYIGYEVGGITGSIVAILATILPSLLLMILLLSILYNFRDSPKVKRMTMFIRPTITVLLGVLTYQFIGQSYHEEGIVQTAVLTLLSLFLLTKLRVHPAFVILGALIYGALFMA